MSGCNGSSTISGCTAADDRKGAGQTQTPRLRIMQSSLTI
eukprot:CAMPEP_0172744830 /NCGR_PEP_ID=MMETSP1074-20121228/136264_1 /TAXON_ID=2916 /ORGANISM="Ceratium fusus, Strain PA161109" /LENGTH=39 /DNA_ID= /DNA_START= /DNA_END= /DNA_ORIENTATION=